jgi:hypothetical protein
MHFLSVFANKLLLLLPCRPRIKEFICNNFALIKVKQTVKQDYTLHDTMAIIIT